MRIKITLAAALILSGLVPLAALAQHNCSQCPNAQCCPTVASADTLKPAQVVYQKLPGFGKKVSIDDSYYFTYKFDKAPKIGVAVLKVVLYKKNGIKDKTFEIIGRSGMPSMGGAHDFEAAFKLNKRGEYLLPVNLVMRGEWEVKLTFKKDGQPVYHGVFTFKV